MTGTIYGADSGNAAPGQVLFSSDQVWQIDNITDGSPATVPANGKIFTIVINPNEAFEQVALHHQWIIQQLP